jgi:hypothetical protein
MAKNNKNKAPVNARVQQQDVEFSEEGVAQVNPAPAQRPAQRAARKKNQK